MKKFVVSVMILLMCFGLCSCGANTLGDAIDEAEEYLETCYVAGCTYAGKYEDNSYYVVAMVPDEYNTNDENECALINAVGNKVQDSVLPKLEGIFSQVECTVILRIYDSDSTPHIVFTNGERKHLCYS